MAEIFIWTIHSFIVTASGVLVAEGCWARSVWMHNPEHRLGVPYANREVAGRFGRNGALGGEADRFAGSGPGFNRGAFPQQQRFGNPGFEQRGWTGNHSVFGGYHNGGMTRMQSDRGFSSMGAGRTSGGFGGGMRAGGFAAADARRRGHARRRWEAIAMTGWLCADLRGGDGVRRALPRPGALRFPRGCRASLHRRGGGHDSARLAAIFGPQSKGF